MPTLYATPLSTMAANSRKPLALCRHLGLHPHVRHIDVNVYRGEGRTPAYLAINPFGKVPTLVDGDLTLWESNAILIYLCEAYGDHRLWSRDPMRRADIARWLFWESSHWQPAFYPILTDFVRRQLKIPPFSPDPVAVNWADPGFHSLARFLDGHLRGRQYLCGADLTIADFSVAAMMTYARSAGFPFGDFPEIGAWYGRIEATEAWRATAVAPWESG